MSRSRRAGNESQRGVVRTGLLYMFGSAVAFSLMTLCAKKAGETLPSIVIVAARQALSVVFCLLLARHADVSLRGTRRGLLTVRALLGTCGLVCFFYAITKLPLADATVIQFTGPIWAAILAALVLHEPVHRTLIASIALSLLGVAVIAQPKFLFGAHALTPAQSLDPLAVTLGLLGTLFSAAAYVSVRQLRRTDEPQVVVFYLAWISSLLVVPWALSTGVIPSGLDWVWLLGTGVLAQLAQEWLTRGLAREPTGPAMATSYVQVILAVFWGWVLFAEVPGPFTLIGVSLIALGTGLVMMQR